MKIQDLVFIITFIFLLWRRNPRLSVWLGLICLILAIPLFKLWIFFTAERLTWYAAAFFTYSVVQLFINELKSSRINENK